MKIVYSTFPKKEDALKMGEELLKRKLIGCFNAFSISSGYWWQGKIERDEEWACIFKTTNEMWKEVVKVIKKLHPYTTPAIFVFNVEYVDEDYEKWLKENVGGE